MKRTLTILVLNLLLCADLTISSADDIYKWRDANGVLHYGNTLPAQDAGLAITTIDKHGLIIKQVSAAPTKAQRETLQAAQVQQDKLNATRTQQQRLDTALLNTYTSPSEIDIARDHNLELTQQVINGIQVRLQILQDKRQQLLKNNPHAIISVVYTHNEQRIHSLTDQLQQKNTERESLLTKYVTEKARFIELTQQPTNEH